MHRRELAYVRWGFTRGLLPDGAVRPAYVAGGS